jgi:hypothetical protein
MATSGESFLLELSSATATKTGAPREERYRLTLNPGINIPYLAEPRAQLEALTFANVFTNIDDDFYQNAKLKVTWNPYVNTASGANVTAAVRHQKELEITLPAGHYNVIGDTLQHKIAELLYTDRTITEYKAPKPFTREGQTLVAPATNYVSATSTLFSDMQLLARNGSQDPHKIVTIPARAYGEKEPPNTQRFIDVTDTAADLMAFVGGWIRLNHSLNGAPVIARIIGVTNNLTDINPTIPTGSDTISLVRCRIHLDRGITGITTGIGGSETRTFHIIPPAFEFDLGSQTHDQVPTTIIEPDYLGYSAAGACPPNYAETSPWALAMTVDEMKSIAAADAKASSPPHQALMGSTLSTQFVKPIAMQPDTRTGLLETATGAPLLKIDNSSTLFTNALGYTVADMNHYEQNPFTHMSLPAVTGEPAVNRAMDASKSGRLLRTTAVSFHCPSLVSSSYNQHGELAGAAMANVPIMVPSNNIQAWQAMYDASIPCNLHGGVVDAIDFYLTNQDGDNIDMMGSDWLATVRLSWNRPSAPPLGSFGAEAESAYGLRDVIYAAQQQNGA